GSPLSALATLTPLRTLASATTGGARLAHATAAFFPGAVLGGTVGIDDAQRVGLMAGVDGGVVAVGAQAETVELARAAEVHLADQRGLVAAPRREVAGEGGDVWGEDGVVAPGAAV